jgi:3-mercaptopyruvate sulfurtransferase SseA
LDEEEFSELLPRNKPAIDKFQLTAREAGINNDDHVIVYSNSDINGYYMSGRAWWTLKVH